MRQIIEEGRSFSGNERDKLFLNRGDGTFADCSDLSACDDPNDGRGVIAADFDDDGDVDMFIHHTQRERHTLQRNELGEGDGFLKVRLRATTAQYEAIGAIDDLEMFTALQRLYLHHNQIRVIENMEFHPALRLLSINNNLCGPSSPAARPAPSRRLSL